MLAFDPNPNAPKDLRSAEDRAYPRTFDVKREEFYGVLIGEPYRDAGEFVQKIHWYKYQEGAISRGGPKIGYIVPVECFEFYKIERGVFTPFIEKYIFGQ